MNGISAILTYGHDALMADATLVMIFPLFVLFVEGTAVLRHVLVIRIYDTSCNFS